MVRIQCTRDYVGSVRDPKTQTYHDIGSDVSKSLANRLVAEYAYVEVASSGAEPGGNVDKTTESEPTCGVNGCSRKVHSPEETCWQHSESGGGN